MTSKEIYARCAHLDSKLVYNIDKDALKTISTDYRTIPTFEKSIFDYVRIRHYSLKRNEKLACRWQTYVDNFHSRVYTPFEFPSNRHFHFQNQVIQYLPEVLNRTEHQMKLKPGPGFDYAGTMPIPNELFMVRGMVTKTEKGKSKKENDAEKIKKRKDLKKK